MDRLSEALDRNVTIIGERAAGDRELVSGLARGHEEELRQIAECLHDDPMQTMVAVAMRLDMLRDSHPELAGDEAFDKSMAAVYHAIGRMRRLMFQLRPPTLKREGLGATIQAALDDERAANPNVRFELRDLTSTEPTEEIRITLFRIAQRALVSSRRRDSIHNVWIRLEERDGGYALTISDDGSQSRPAGPDDAARDVLDLGGIRARAELAGGTFCLRSDPAGETLECWLPVSPAA